MAICGEELKTLLLCSHRNS